MFTECVNCGFYASPDVKSCPDCGVSAPGEPLKFKADDFDRPLIFKLTAAFVILIFGGIVFFRLREGNNDFSDLFGLFGIVVLFSIVPAMFVSFFVLFYRKKTERRRFALTETTATNFQFMQDMILQRNHELHERLREFRAAKRGVRLSVDYGKSNHTPRKMEILNLIARYALLDSKIDFARLENKLPLLVKQRNALKDDEDFSEKLDAVWSEIESIKSSLTDDSAAEVSENFQVEKRDFLAQVEEAEKLCEALSKRGGELQSFDSIRRADNFAVHQTLGNFIKSFNESEREYQKLKI